MSSNAVSGMPKCSKIHFRPELCSHCSPDPLRPIKMGESREVFLGPMTFGRCAIAGKIKQSRLSVPLINTTSVSDMEAIELVCS